MQNKLDQNKNQRYALRYKISIDLHNLINLERFHLIHFINFETRKYVFVRTYRMTSILSSYERFQETDYKF